MKDGAGASVKGFAFAAEMAVIALFLLNLNAVVPQLTCATKGHVSWGTTSRADLQRLLLFSQTRSYKDPLSC
ncbi:MAG: hypothetical protein AVDCRST_MAG93-8899 [uncultured Chloroflexia bacterium]|uniref:Uncharacterized protein n=1 Tax=uncultured Chloroflexia bacterium TaxID=1672391 RepID=A0A6J4N7B3_9CHLR|nr:MAG: hypothetical protein AVDCRST_MAG93-8899 [uncultured Chloroflexia bacterium]